MARPAAILCVVGLAREAAIAGPPFAIGAHSIPRDLSGFDAVMSFGLCGALDPDLRPGDLIVGDEVTSEGRRLACDGPWTDALFAALPRARRGLIAGSTGIVATPDQKASLRAGTGAIAVDMESAAAGRAAAEAGIPLVILRAVSDAADCSLPRSAQAGFSATGEPDVGAVIAALIRRPWELPRLLRAAVEAEAGFRGLLQARAALDRSFPNASQGPDG